MAPPPRPRPLDARPLLPAPSRPGYRSHEIVDRAFSPGECDRIVALGTARAAETGALSAAAGAREDATLRRSRISWVPPGPGADWIYARLARLVARANRRWRFELTGFAEDLQFTRYDEPGAFYTWHQDGLDGEVALRKLAVVVQLSDPDHYGGGDLQLFDVSVDLDPADLADWTARVRARGAAVVFPAFEYHRVMPLEHGERHSLVAWVSGPPFR